MIYCLSRKRPEGSNDSVCQGNVLKVLMIYCLPRKRSEVYDDILFV